MAHPKRRVRQHIMESESVRLVQEILPHEWVIREYKPDYGIDLSVDIFKYIDEQKNVAEALGDFVFAQVKSAAAKEIDSLKVHARFNVAKGGLREDKAEAREIEVLKLQLEADELITIESMGHGLPVLLFLVTLDTQQLFFLCLNDLLDKVIIPADPEYAEKGSKIINVPLKNEIRANDPVSVTGIRFYAKRPKFYSAFSLFEYQRNELSYCTVENSALLSELGPEPDAMVRHFLRLLDRLDVWEDTEMWPVVGKLRNLLDNLKASLATTVLTPQLFAETLQIWDRLVSLSHNYEELCRERFLPTFLAQELSYSS